MKARLKQLRQTTLTQGGARAASDQHHAYDAKCIDFVVSRGTFESKTHAAKYLASLGVPGALMSACVDSHVFASVRDWRAFLAGLAVLAKDPYHRGAFGEQERAVFEVRRSVAAAVDASPTIKRATSMQAFAAWCLFQQHPSQAYVATAQVRWRRSNRTPCRHGRVRQGLS
jgi:hypothetical protein